MTETEYESAKIYSTNFEVYFMPICSSEYETMSISNFERRKLTHKCRSYISLQLCVRSNEMVKELPDSFALSLSLSLSLKVGEQVFLRLEFFPAFCLHCDYRQGLGGGGGGSDTADYKLQFQSPNDSFSSCIYSCISHSDIYFQDPPPHYVLQMCRTTFNIYCSHML